ncbi:flagellin N-terminal helical domain-containing protein [Celerinatantimonas diazotrophica]|uniref:Flagellin n=1 Tax=Celerinatantimonas diazotrophica TaxID=412034 RepID=A0A4R1JM59_9GAMM|nr:flagellin [Celerinatantimonas diazotrophica]TCK52164.1 flagellin [Celerinatantimonas diazotrophica]CAG9296131.1 Flagellar filament 33 kDa core protein [Celerinatantimonas diazotrophica]
MALYVNTNISSLNAQRQLSKASSALNTSFQRLASGSRINSAKDDAAGLQISNRMTAQIQGLNRASLNAQDGISISQTAEGAMDELTSSLQRIRSLAIQAQDGVNNSDDRNALQSEVSQLKTEMSRVAQTTQFGGVNILNGTFSAKFLVGANAGAQQNISVNIENPGGWGTSGLNLGSLSVNSVPQASAAVATVDNAIKKVDSQRAKLGAVQNRFQSTIRNLTNISSNVTEARSRIKDTDYAKETANLTKNRIIQKTATTILAQANQRPQAALSLLG